jgi:hypothetical protein
VPFEVRLRPNVWYLLVIVLAAAVVTYGATQALMLAIVTTSGGLLMLAVFGYPVVVSTICRVPVVVVDSTGVRFPLLGVRLGWGEVARVAIRSDTRKMLLIYPVDSSGVFRQMRPWLRSQARTEFARHGTPIVVGDRSLDHSVDDILCAVNRFRPSA